MGESREERLERLRSAIHALVMHDPFDSFRNLIENHRSLFKDFRVIYSTNNIDGHFSSLSLRKIEESCPTIKKFFYGSGLLFYSDTHYSKTESEGAIKIPIDYSLSLDSNLAERFRVWEKKGSLGQEKKRLEGLIRFIKGSVTDGFNFDYSFFLLENLIDSMKPDNTRPFETIRALKRFDFLSYENNSFDVSKPIFLESRDSAGKRAIQALHSFHSSKEAFDFLNRRDGLYLILLKAIILREQKELSLYEVLEALIIFSLESLGSFAKTEIYFAWKLFKYGNKLSFFNSVSQLTEKSVHKIRGMAWDLYAIRYQETLTSKSNLGDFFVPFFASFDNRFIELSQACPIRAVIIDDVEQRALTVFLDEYEFMKDLNIATTDELRSTLNNAKRSVKRMSSKPSSKKLKNKAHELESKLSSLVRS